MLLNVVTVELRLWLHSCTTYWPWLWSWIVPFLMVP